MNSRTARSLYFLTLLALLLPVVAEAHTGAGVVGGFKSGFLHPLGGLDHVVAMVAVGLWGAQLGAPAIWLLPVAFPLVMAVGGALGVRGIPVPAVETGIAISGIVLGLMVTFAVRAPLAVAAVIVSVFAVFHGYAHGAELPTAAAPLAYSAGFVVATGLLHACGIAIGALIQWKAGDRIVRTCGVAIALTGLWFLLG